MIINLDSVMKIPEGLLNEATAYSSSILFEIGHILVKKIDGTTLALWTCNTSIQVTAVYAVTVR